jgi:dihydrofolate synthase/folylpolyglutamate synthase
MSGSLSYPDAVRALQARGRFGMRLGLERITAILDRLDHPERGLHGALVAGTNGKGSVVALARAALGAAGTVVGTMPKPHLVAYRERIALDGMPISEDAFAEAVARVLPEADAVAASMGAPTEFEILTAVAFAELARRRVDLALVEVGLGGRLDATNVLDAGVAVVTNVARDHERHLGRTLAAIGGEKAAIIKRGNLAVTGARGRGLRPIEERCAALDAPLRRAGTGQPYRWTLRESGWDGVVLDARAGDRELPGLRVGLLGPHQAENATVALALLDALREDAERRDTPLAALDDDAVRRGFAGAVWPGRLELIEHRAFGRVLLDGAHNPAGARALAVALRGLGVHGAPLVFGAMRDKRATPMLRALAPLGLRPVFTRVAEATALPPSVLAARWAKVGGNPAAEAPDPGLALEMAAQIPRPADQPLVVAGSLYLVGQVRGMLLGERSEA